jgi:hypothetical protein
MINRKNETYLINYISRTVRSWGLPDLDLDSTFFLSGPGSELYLVLDAVCIKLQQSKEKCIHETQQKSFPSSSVF